MIKSNNPHLAGGETTNLNPSQSQRCPNRATCMNQAGKKINIERAHRVEPGGGSKPASVRVELAAVLRYNTIT